MLTISVSDVQRIFATLERYDRLNLPRLKFYSRLTDRQLHHGLAAMIQQNLVFHYTSYDDGVTYYEANQHAAYYLTRSGKILEFIEGRLGQYAATLMSAIMYLGHASVSHLETLPELRPEPPQTNGINGEHKHEQDEANGEHEDQPNGINGEHALSEQPYLLHPTLKTLAAHGYILRAREAHFQSYTDTVLDAERVVTSRPDVKSMKGKKLEETVIEKTLEIVKEKTDGDLSHGLKYNGVPRGAKRGRGAAQSNKPIKKAQTEQADADEDDEEDEEENEWSDDEMGNDTVPMDVGVHCLVFLGKRLTSLQSSLVIRVNYEKLDVALRHCRFIGLAEQDSSPVTAEVYESLLRRIEYQTPRCRDTVEIPREGEEGEQYSVPIPLSAIAEDVDQQLDLSGSIGPMDISQPFSRRGKRPLEDGVNGTSDEGTNGLSSGASRTYELDQHLCLLAQPPHNLTSKRIVGGLITWTVEYRYVARTLRHLELEKMIEARYGDVALRVVRVLHAKGKLDEKRLQEISLLPFKDLRQVLASMQTGGYVDLQEVPRDAQRQPSRTIFLWFYDPDRVASSVLEDVYKAMSRCLQRLKFERSRLREFLEKTERSDVKGNEEQYLSEGELKMLEQWKAKEALLFGEVSRLDNMVAVFRDY